MKLQDSLATNRTEWLHFLRKLDWDFSYVKEEDVYPEVMSGTSLSAESWEEWEEPFKTTFSEYIEGQAEKDQSVYAVKEAIGAIRNLEEMPKEWVSGLKLYAATLPLAEFAAVVGNLRAARFAKNSAWRNMALLGAMDEFRHTQIPLLLMHDFVRVDAQFDWTHKFYHTNNWVSIAARHMLDELLLMNNPVEFALATHFVFETGFTNLQFVGLSALSHSVGDHIFEKMIKSIQTDEARHAQIGSSVLEIMVKQDKAYVQYVLDKWFWRNWHLFSVVTGFSMDYLTPLAHRTKSFKEFMEEWIIDQYISSLSRYGLEKPWYWDIFLKSLDSYHHMVYLSAYSYRSTVWFDTVLPSHEDREWLKEKYPEFFYKIEGNWQQLEKRWEQTDPGVDFAVHGTSIIGFCNLCQMVLSEGSPDCNHASTVKRDGNTYILCSDPCRWIFESEYEKYGQHKDLVKRVLAGEAPGNLLEMVRRYFGLQYKDWGKDMFQGNYSWLTRNTSPK